MGIIAVGVCFAAFFHIFTKEPSAQQKESKEGKRIPWYKWFTNPQFYAVRSIRIVKFSSEIFGCYSYHSYSFY